MSPSALFFELQAAGVTLTARGDRLKVEAARGTITPELLARMKAAKPDLLAILTGNTPAISGLSKPRGSIPNDTASVDTVPAPDLPLLEALEEFDALIDRLCNKHRYSESVRAEMMNARRRMSPDALRAELPIIRRAAQ